jgi:hypothetical protein
MKVNFNQKKKRKRENFLSYHHHLVSQNKPHNKGQEREKTKTRSYLEDRISSCKSWDQKNEKTTTPTNKKKNKWMEQVTVASTKLPNNNKPTKEKIKRKKTGGAHF